MNPTDSTIPRLNTSGCADPTVYEVLKREQRAQFGYQPLAYIRIPFAGNIEANTRLARRMCAAAITQPCSNHANSTQTCSTPKTATTSSAAAIKPGRCIQ